MLYFSLVGEQPIPILLPLWQLEGITQVKLIATNSTREVAENLIQFIRKDPKLFRLKILPILYVDAYDLKRDEEQIRESILNCTDPVMLNLTGGTKIMSLACLQAAKGTKAQLLYVSMEERNLLFFTSDHFETELVPIFVKISVSQYLNTLGLEVSDSQNFAEKHCDIIPPKEGDELEERIFAACTYSGLFDDVRRNTFIRNVQGDHSVINELDVVVTHNGNLAVCSCKSGKLEKNMLYELASLSRREVAGIYCVKILASSQKTIPPGILKRAKQDHIRLIRAEELDRSAQIIYQCMSQ